MGNTKARENMENLALKKDMIEKYRSIAFTDSYIIGFTYNKNVYYQFADGNSMENFTCLDRASRGAGMALRFRPTRDMRAYMATFSKVLCSKEYFDSLVSESKYNRGEIFEKLITEIVAGKVWEKDSVSFTKASDVEINGKPYQIKFSNATITNEKTLHNLLIKG